MTWIYVLLVSFAAKQSQCALNPVILIPGLTASSLQYKLSGRSHENIIFDYGCKGDKDWTDMWLDPWTLIKENVCLLEDMTITSSVSNARCGTYAEGVQVREKDFGGTGGVSALGTSFLFPGIPVFRDLIKSLKRYEFKVGETLFGLPVNWMMYGDECYTRLTLFPRMKALFEQVVTRNNGSPVRIVCQSMGCVYIKDFLHSLEDLKWVQTHILEVVAVTPAYAGSVDAIAAQVNPSVMLRFETVPDSLIPSSILSYIGKTFSSFPGFFVSYPKMAGNFNPWVDEDGLTDTVFVNNIENADNPVTWTARNISTFAKSIVTERHPDLYPALFNEWTESFIWNREDIPFIVPTSCLIGVGLPTIQNLAVPTSNARPQTQDGDQTVATESSKRMCQHWGGDVTFFNLTNTDTDHENTLMNPDLIQYILVTHLLEYVSTEEAAQSHGYDVSQVSVGTTRDVGILTLLCLWTLYTSV